jgi:hypothetical protein
MAGDQSMGVPKQEVKGKVTGRAKASVKVKVTHAIDNVNRFMTIEGSL